MSLSEYIRHAEREIATAPPTGLQDVLRDHLAKLVGDPYVVSTLPVVDADGARVDNLVVISTRLSNSNTREVAADACASVIECVNTLDSTTLPAAYNRIVAAKRLRKSPLSPSGVSTNTTLGVVLAQSSTLSGRQILDQLGRLNSATHSDVRPDMFVVASFAVVNFAVQFPGEPISGDYLPPVIGALASSVPPISIVQVLKPSADEAFLRFVAFLCAHLGLFAPAAVLPDRRSLATTPSAAALVGAAFQYNLAGVVIPVVLEQALECIRPTSSMTIEDQNGKHLAAVTLLPWQDGGVVALKGKFPLEVLLLFGGNELVRGGILKRPNDVQLSNVIPLSRSEFGELMSRVRSASNFKIVPNVTTWTFQKVADEGTSTPIVGRLQIGILHLRDIVCSEEASRRQFDELYEPVLSAVMSARQKAKALEELWTRHSASVSSGAAARVDGRMVHVDESIDSEMKAGVEGFVNAAVRALKSGMQELMKHLQLDISFLFQQDSKFEQGCAVYRATDPDVAEYLVRSRVWSQPLLRLRNDIEHKGWMLPRVLYAAVANRVVAQEPEVNGVAVTRYVPVVLDHLACFVEEMITYGLMRSMSPWITLTEVPSNERTAATPERFRIDLAGREALSWRLQYREGPFDAR